MEDVAEEVAVLREGGGAAGRRVANDEHGEIQPRCTYVSLEGVRNATRRQAGRRGVETGVDRRFGQLSRADGGGAK